MTLAEDIAGWLLQNRGPDGRVLDPVHRENGTYADGWAALSFGLMAYRTGERRWGEACDQSAALARRQPPESEFDQLALLLLAHVAERRQSPPPGSGGVPGASEIAVYPGGRLVSNNWVAMRALSRSLQVRFPDAALLALWARVLRWQDRSGLFVDAPIGVAMPVTYHAKFCATLGLAALLAPERCPVEGIRSGLRRGLDVLITLISPAGMLAPYGRSRNALFGYAAAVTALRCGAAALEEPGYLGAASALLRRMASFQQTDGHVPCVLNEGEESRHDWDVYVNNPDYNAYAAGLLLLLEELLGPLGDTEPQRPADEVREIGPLVVARNEGLYAVLCGRGQSAPHGTPFFCDYRYYGMQPLYLEIDGEAVAEPEPYRWPGENRRLLTWTGAQGWLPFVPHQGQAYLVRAYDEVKVERRGDLLVVEGCGVPEAYLPVSRWERGLRRVLGKPALQFRSRKLPGVVLTRSLKLNLDSGRLRASAALEGGAGLKLEPGRIGWEAAREVGGSG